jgi:ferritin
MAQLMSDALREAVCLQVAHEMLNANIYLYVASFLKNKGLDNIAKHFEGQWTEELGHAHLFIDLLTDLNVPVMLPEIPACDMPINSIGDIAKIYLDREILTTESIASLRDMATDENPVAEEMFRSMIVKQQNEYEEATTFMDKAELTGDWKSVFLWDIALGS